MEIDNARLLLWSRPLCWVCCRNTFVHMQTVRTIPRKAPSCIVTRPFRTSLKTLNEAPVTRFYSICKFSPNCMGLRITPISPWSVQGLWRRYITISTLPFTNFHNPNTYLSCQALYIQYCSWINGIVRQRKLCGIASQGVDTTRWSIMCWENV